MSGQSEVLKHMVSKFRIGDYKPGEDIVSDDEGYQPYDADDTADAQPEQPAEETQDTVPADVSPSEPAEPEAAENALSEVPEEPAEDDDSPDDDFEAVEFDPDNLPDSIDLDDETDDKY